MISKISKAKDSWFVKGILVLTALSFMSLFGVAGYLTAPKNKPVIKVGNIIVYQDELNLQLENEMRTARNIFGENLEITDEIKSSMLQGIVQRELENAIITETSRDLHVYVSDDLIRAIIYSQPQFLDENGNFSIERLRQLLQMSGWTEARYIETLRRDIIKQQLVYNPLSNLNVPKVLENKVAELENQERTFQYVKIDPNKMKIDRKISQEELEQYYQDFSMNFMEPEKRDVSFIVLDDAGIKAQIMNTDEEAYDDEVYNLISDIEDRIGQGMNLEDIASGLKVKINNVKGLTEEGVSGKLQYGNLINSEDFVNTAFSYNVGEISQVMETDSGWVIIRVDNIKDAHPKELALVKGEIEKIWAESEKTAIAQEIINDVQNDLNNGDNIKEIAQRFDLKLQTTKPLKRSESFEELSQNDIIDLFQEKAGVAKIIDNGNIKIVAIAASIVNSNKKMSEEESDTLKKSIKIDLMKNYANTLLEDYASDYDVRVKYRQIGLTQGL